jgi:hypothetical protein
LAQSASTIRSIKPSSSAPHLLTFPVSIAKDPSMPSAIKEKTRSAIAQLLSIFTTKVIPSSKPKIDRAFGVTLKTARGLQSKNEISNHALTIPFISAPP